MGRGHRPPRDSCIKGRARELETVRRHRMIGARAAEVLRTVMRLWGVEKGFDSMDPRNAYGQRTATRSLPSPLAPLGGQQSRARMGPAAGHRMADRGGVVVGRWLAGGCAGGGGGMVWCVWVVAAVVVVVVVMVCVCMGWWGGAHGCG